MPEPLRLSDEAQQALDRAYAEARRFRHRSVGTEHLLIALCGDESAAARVLGNYGVSEAAVRTTLEMSVPIGMTPPWQEIDDAPALRAALRRADDAARARGAREVSPAQLLAAVTEDASSPAARMLAFMGVDLDWLRKRLDGPHQSPKDRSSD